MALPSARAATLRDPTGPVVLTVTGKIGVANAGPKADFDLAMLEELPGRTTTIETPWTKGLVAFQGPLCSVLLDRLRADGTVLHIVALNDYAVDVPISDCRQWPVILATRKDGKPMPVRDKGPLFLIYPFDAEPALYNEKIFTRSAWQIRSIDIR
ncbi:hypothetical protein EYW49_08535 [Siculibacillus lacustris]|uniref:Oxidoreductase n=1 Tax=Siculibacillus lacustris TaxID=1549641 RepID=A0A4Q9VS72_9HYPH|nr:hypothetical protein EYW49_08535 [Siculibacillus lacustris]